MNFLNSIKFVVVLVALFVHSSKQKNFSTFKTLNQYDLSFQKVIKKSCFIVYNFKTFFKF